MDLTALLECVTTLSCVVTQTTSGLIIGVLLFLVAAGLTGVAGAQVRAADSGVGDDDSREPVGDHRLDNGLHLADLQVGRHL